MCQAEIELGRIWSCSFFSMFIVHRLALFKWALNHGWRLTPQPSAPSLSQWIRNFLQNWPEEWTVKADLGSPPSFFIKHFLLSINYTLMHWEDTMQRGPCAFHQFVSVLGSCKILMQCHSRVETLTQSIPLVRTSVLPMLKGMRVWVCACSVCTFSSRVWLYHERIHICTAPARPAHRASPSPWGPLPPPPPFLSSSLLSP